MELAERTVKSTRQYHSLIGYLAKYPEIETWEDLGRALRGLDFEINEEKLDISLREEKKDLIALMDAALSCFPPWDIYGKLCSRLEFSKGYVLEDSILEGIRGLSEYWP